MSNWGSIREKKSFLKWFLQNHRLKRTDAKFILDHIINNSHILENVCFTDSYKKNTRIIMISSLTSDEIGFEYYNNNRRTEDVSRAVNDLIMQPNETIYLLLHFHGKMLNHKYLNIVGHPALENVRRYKKYEEYSKETNRILDKSIVENKVTLLKKQIDQALDNNDEALFKSLSLQLNNLTSQLRN